MKNSKIVANNVREIHFLEGGTEISPARVFNLIYTPLDQLIAHNTGMQMTPSDTSGRRHSRRHRMSYDHEVKDEAADALFRDAAETLEKISERLKARITFETGGKRTFRIHARTNYHSSILKHPSIVYLRMPDAPQIILREARDYPVHKGTPVQYFGRHKYGNKFNVALFDEEAQKRDGPLQRTCDMMIVPEAPLILALERLALERLIPGRITPRPVFIGHEGRNLWYLRNFLPGVRDSSVSDEQAGRYAGILHGLGLFDEFDLDVGEYSIDRNSVVNIDPDLFLYSASLPALHDRGFRSIRNSFGRIVPSLDLEKLRKVRNAVFEQTRRLMDGKTVLDFLPKELDDSYILAEDRFTVENYNSESAA